MVWLEECNYFCLEILVTCLERWIDSCLPLKTILRSKSKNTFKEEGGGGGLSNFLNKDVHRRRQFIFASI